MATQQSVIATAKESSGSSPQPKEKQQRQPAEASEQARVGSIYRLRTDNPDMPPDVEPAFQQASTDDLSAGNPAYTIELKEHGHLGLFLKRPNAKRIPTFVEINPRIYFDAIQGTLHSVIMRLLVLKTELSDTEIANRADYLSDVLATGVCVETFLKLRAIILNYPERYSSVSLKRPRVSSALPVPAAFAVALQQFGEVNIADLLKERLLIPCFPSNGHTFGVPPPRSWSAYAYSQAVEYARSLGMRFSVIDPKVKNGSAWWLLRQYFAEDVFELQCTQPEVNFTEGNALTHSLFLKETGNDISNPFMRIASLGSDNYGTLLSNPHQGINISSFHALSDSASDIWQNV